MKDDAVRAQVLLMLMAEEKRMTKNSMQVTLSPPSVSSPSYSLSSI